jgi:hypothetical protein
MAWLDLLPVGSDETLLPAYSGAERTACGFLIGVLHEILGRGGEWLVFEGTLLLWVARMEGCCAITSLCWLKGNGAGI